MDRKGIIAISLSLLGLVAWMYYNNQEMKKVAAQRALAQALAPAAPPTQAAQVAAAQKAADAVAKTEAAAGTASASTVPEQRETLSTPSVNYTFTTHGGGIATALLKGHEAEGGTRMTLNEFGTIPIGATSEKPGEGTENPFTCSVKPENGVVTFESADAGPLHLTKEFAVPQSTTPDKDYIVALHLTYQNRGKDPVTLPRYFAYTGSAAPVHQRDLSNYTGFKWSQGKFIDVNWFAGGWFKAAQPAFTASKDQIAWAAVANQYFTTLITPVADAPQQPRRLGDEVWAERFSISDAVWQEANHTAAGGNSGGRYGIEGALGMPGFTLAPGESLRQSFQIYAGPREYGRLRLMPDGESDVLAFSDVGGLFSFLGPFIGFFSKLLLFSLNSIHAWVGSYAVAVIILTLIIKALLWPMQNKATRSMKRMQLLQPKMTELRDKYKEDPTRMNAEVMKLYRDYGVNPMGGCLPAFVQMPIFFGFYNMLGKAVELRNSKFLWVHDLSQPDTLFYLPGLNFPVNVLPLLMAATMLWQMWASPKTGDKTQQQMFMFMPLIFVLFCYNYASALALYLTVNNLVSVLQLYATRNQAAPSLQKKLPRPRKA